MKKSYLLRDIPKDLWKRVKVKCNLEGRSIRAVIIARLERWVNGE